MKLKLFALAITAAALTNANAASVSVQSGFSYAIVTSNGSALNVGEGWMAVGYFASLTDDVVPLTPAADLAADFQIFADATSSFGAAGFGGLFNHSADAGFIPEGSSNPFLGNNIYFIAANGASLATSTEAVIYKFSETFIADPAPPTPPSATDLTPSFNEANYLLGAPGQEFPIATTVIPAAGMGEIVPEPSTALVGLLGVGLLALRRRRD